MSKRGRQSMRRSCAQAGGAAGAKSKRQQSELSASAVKHAHAIGDNRRGGWIFGSGSGAPKVKFVWRRRRRRLRTVDVWPANVEGKNRRFAAFSRFGSPNFFRWLLSRPSLGCFAPVSRLLPCRSFGCARLRSRLRSRALSRSRLLSGSVSAPLGSSLGSALVCLSAVASRGSPPPSLLDDQHLLRIQHRPQ